MSSAVASPPPPSIFPLYAIKRALPSNAALLEALADSFVTLSRGRCVLGAVGHLGFGEQGDACIKSAFLRGGEVYVVKVAASFYENPKKAALPSCSGLMLVLSQRTGVPRAVLLDEGHLTDRRTALAACVTVRALAPQDARCVGLVGPGTISRQLLTALPCATACRNLRVWARRPEAAAALCAEALGTAGGGWQSAGVASSTAELLAECDVIITCTPSNRPLLAAADLARRPPSAPGLHICALGADAAGKQEVEVELLRKCDLLVADSRAQCLSFGELSHAKRAGLVGGAGGGAPLVELGELLSHRAHLQRGGPDDRRLTLADSTGVGASDLCIAEAAYRELVAGGAPIPTPPTAHRWRRSGETVRARL